MMSEKQYRVARKGIVEQIKLAQKLHCVNLEEAQSRVKEVGATFLKTRCNRLF